MQLLLTQPAADEGIWHHPCLSVHKIRSTTHFYIRPTLLLLSYDDHNHTSSTIIILGNVTKNEPSKRVDEPHDVPILLALLPQLHILLRF
jgi:hypothetical protein